MEKKQPPAPQTGLLSSFFLLVCFLHIPLFAHSQQGKSLSDTYEQNTSYGGESNATSSQNILINIQPDLVLVLPEEDLVPFSIDFIQVEGDRHLVLLLENEEGHGEDLGHYTNHESQFVEDTLKLWPAVPSGKYRLMAEYYWNDQQHFIYSDWFEIINDHPAIQIKEPRDDSYWAAGQYYFIVFNVNKIDRADIDYSTNGGETWANITTNWGAWGTLANGFSLAKSNWYGWTVPENLGGHFEESIIRIKCSEDPDAIAYQTLTLSNIKPLSIIEPTTASHVEILSDLQMTVYAVQPAYIYVSIRELGYEHFELIGEFMADEGLTDYTRRTDLLTVGKTYELQFASHKFDLWLVSDPFIIQKATPEVSWPTATDITYGETTSAAIFSGGSARHDGSTLPGNFSFLYPDSIPRAGMYSAGVRFTPGNTEIYRAMESTIEIHVLPKPVSVIGAEALDKTYDGDLLATIIGAELNGVIGPDEVFLFNHEQGMFSQTGVGTNIPVSVNMGIGGEHAPNYDLIQPLEYTASIIHRELQIEGSFSVADKEYDNVIVAVIDENTLVLKAVVDGDHVSLQITEALYAQTNIGQEIEVGITSAALQGEDKENYFLSLNNAPITLANILPKTLLVINAVAQDKVYDTNAETGITGAGVQGVVNQEEVLLDNHQVGHFIQTTPGSNIQVITEMHIIGSDHENYILAQPEDLRATIFQKEIHLDGSFQVEDKEYDGRLGAVIAEGYWTTIGAFEGEEVMVATATAAFTQKQAGENIPVEIIEATLEGADKNNYMLSLTGAPVATASITFKELLIGGSFKAADKIYDGTTVALIQDNQLVLTGSISGDDVYLTDVITEFTQSEIADSVPVFITEASPEGVDKLNYKLSLEGAPTSFANITPDDLSAHLYEESTLIIYPNPATNVLFLESDIPLMAVRIVNMSGHEVYHARVSGNTHQIKLAHLPAGIYLLQAFYHGKHRTLKFHITELF